MIVLSKLPLCGVVGLRWWADVTRRDAATRRVFAAFDGFLR